MKNNKTKLLTIRLTEAEFIKAKMKGRGNMSYWLRQYINYDTTESDNSELIKELINVNEKLVDKSIESIKSLKAEKEVLNAEIEKLKKQINK
jgi:cell division protein FtsB